MSGAITDEQLQELVESAKTYTLMLLRWGPGRYREDAPGIIWEHGRRNAALRADGVMPIVAPVGDDSLVGAGIFTVDPDQTRKIMDADPGVVAGLFTYELHPCRSFPGSTLPDPAEPPTVGRDH